jgi:DNA-binding beta-propeller fold protein YncE
MRIVASVLGLVVASGLLLGTAAPATAAISEPRSVSAGVDPTRIAVTPDGAQAWILATTSNELIGYTTGATLTNIASWPLPGTDYGNANVAILPDGKRAIVTDASGEQVNIVDLTTGVITNPPELNGPEPTDVALSPDGSKVAIAYADGAGPVVSVFNTSDWSFVAVWGFGSELTSLAFSPDGRYFAAAASATSRIYVMDVSVAGDYVVTFSMPEIPSTIAYSSDGESIFVGSFGGASIRKFEAITGMELLSLSAPNTGYLAVSPDGTQLWASQPVAAQVGVYNTSNLSLVEAIPFSANANGIAFAQLGCQAWVAQEFAGAALVYDLDPCLSVPVPALPDTGASPSVVGTSVAVSAGLLAAGAIALFVVSRRSAKD